MRHLFTPALLFVCVNCAAQDTWSILEKQGMKLVIQQPLQSTYRHFFVPGSNDTQYYVHFKARPSVFSVHRMEFLSEGIFADSIHGNSIPRRYYYGINDRLDSSITFHVSSGNVTERLVQSFGAYGPLHAMLEIYNQSGNITATQNNWYDYDGQGRLIRDSSDVGGTTYTYTVTKNSYDGNGLMEYQLRLSEISAPGGPVAGIDSFHYSYDASGRLVSALYQTVAPPGLPAFKDSFEYVGSSNHYSTRYYYATLNNIWTRMHRRDMGYNAQGQLISLSDSVPNTTYILEYDGFGRPSRKYVSTGGDTTFYNYAWPTSVTKTGLEGPQINIFPNPASKTLHLELPEAGNIFILDIHGRVIRSQRALQKDDIDISGLTPGIYYLQIAGSGSGVRFVRE